jgi:hypothetical protein
VSGNLVDGIAVWGSASTGTVIQGNLIGTDLAGTHPIPNGFNGVRLIDVSGAQIGGVGAGQRNVSSGNGDSGIVLTRGEQNRVVGNYIGTDITGTHPLGNRVDGIYVPDSSSNEIGGSELGEGNVIGDNGAGGIDLVGASHGNAIVGNRIGVDVTGSSALPNFVGIRIAGGTGNRIGTNADRQSDDLERNIISGNLSAGIAFDSGSSENTVAGNYVGIAADGSTILGNAGNGITIANSSHNLIGGSGQSARNVISGNATHGIVVLGPAATSNRVQGNSLYANGGLGIDLENNGATLNDAGDSDSGANDIQNFPTLNSAQAGATTHVSGTLNSTASSTFTLDFYSSAAIDPSGFGEGQRWLGSIVVSTDAAGNAAFNGALLAATATGEFVTATATDAAGNTSEISSSLMIQSRSVLIDVKPGSSTNPVNLHENGVIPIAILTTPDFDAIRVNANTVVFAGASAVHSALEDVDFDGDLDMVMHFRVQDTNLRTLYAQLLLDDLEDHVLDDNHHQASVALSGETVDEVFFAGVDDLDLFLAGKNLRDFLNELATLGQL